MIALQRVAVGDPCTMFYYLVVMGLYLCKILSQSLSTHTRSFYLRKKAICCYMHARQSYACLLLLICYSSAVHLNRNKPWKQ